MVAPTVALLRDRAAVFNTMLVIILLTLGTNPREVEISVDCIELNHLYDSEGRYVYDQVILWQKYCDNEQHVVGWRLVKTPLCFTNGFFILRDGDFDRKIQYKMFRESWTQHDPEVVDRGRWPKEKRSGLNENRFRN